MLPRNFLPHAAALMLVGARMSHAQPRNAGGATWGAIAGLARNSPGNLWGAARGHDIAVVLVQRVRPLFRTGPVQWDYVLDLVPGAWVSVRRPGPVFACPDRDKSDGCPYNGPQQAMVYGAGAAPIGFEGRVRGAPWLQGYLSGSGGVLSFVRPVPVDRGGRWNFTAAFGAGVYLGRPRAIGTSIGYQFYHVSNGGTARANPGVDGHMVTIGIHRIPM